MSDKELIKQEIEKRLSLLWDLIPEGEKVLKDDFTKEDANNLGKYTELESLLKFIDSLPEESTSEDLEKEIDRCWEGWIDPNPEVKCVDGYLSKDEFSVYAHHFAEWQKQQMMKDAVEGEYWIGEIHLDAPIIQGYDDGDRIKFIPIKTEQQ